MFMLRPYRIPRAAAFAAALLATPALATPRLDHLIEVHRAEAATTTYGLLRARPAHGVDVLAASAGTPSFVQVATALGTPESCPSLLRHSFTPVQGGAPPAGWVDANGDQVPDPTCAMADVEDCAASHAAAF